jgi:hypothetical protein
VFFNVLRFEIVAPKHDDFVLAHLGVLFFDSRIAGELHDVRLPFVLASTDRRHLQSLNELHHPNDGERGELRDVWVIDAARNIAVSVRNAGRSNVIDDLQQVIE